MNRRVIIIIAALVLALGMGFILWGVLTAPRKVTPPPRNVVQTAMRVPLHAHITPVMLTVVQKPADQVDPAALANPSDAVGQIAMGDIPQGTPLTPGMIARPATPAPELLHVRDGMRAITINLDPVKGVAGLLRPGDHVDVIAAPPRGPGQPEAYAIVRDARVLAVGTEVANAPDAVVAPAASGAPPPTPAPNAATTATLEVTPAQATLVTSADLNGVIRLALRSPKERLDSLPAQSIFYPTPEPALTPTPGPTGIPVINGDTIKP